MPEIDVEGSSSSSGTSARSTTSSFTVADGELFTLLGPSGCGKSTTLMSIAGFQTPNEGRIAVGGEPIFDASNASTCPPSAATSGSSSSPMQSGRT